MISAELWAIFHGLKLSLDKGWKHITVESDSAEAMKLISNSGLVDYTHASIVLDIYQKICLLACGLLY